MTLRRLLYVFVFLFGVTLSSQEESQDTNIFVRVYDLNGKKIGKGKLQKLYAASIQIKKRKEVWNIPVNRIGFIRTKRSGGNSILAGMISTATVFAILGAVDSYSDDTLESAFFGGFVGAALGSVLGGIGILSRNAQKIYINGDVANLKEFNKIVGEKWH